MHGGKKRVWVVLTQFFRILGGSNLPMARASVWWGVLQSASRTEGSIALGLVG